MKQIHIWPNHIAIAHADLVLWRPANEPVAETLTSLIRLGFDARPSNIEWHPSTATA